MHITLKLYATLRRYQPDLPRGASLSLDVPSGTTVHQLLSLVGIPERAALVALVNGKVQKMDYILSEGDAVDLFPPVAGG